MRAAVGLSGASLPSGFAFPPGYHFGDLRLRFSPLGIPFVPQELPRHVFRGAFPSTPCFPSGRHCCALSPHPRWRRRRRARALPHVTAPVTPSLPGVPRAAPRPRKCRRCRGSRSARPVPLPPWESRPSSAGSAASTPPSSSTASKRR